MIQRSFKDSADARNSTFHNWLRFEARNGGELLLNIFDIKFDHSLEILFYFICSYDLQSRARIVRRVWASIDAIDGGAGEIRPLTAWVFGGSYLGGGISGRDGTPAIPPAYSKLLSAFSARVERGAICAASRLAMRRFLILEAIFHRLQSSLF